MNQQSEALRLADECDEGMVDFAQAAAELRRLHDDLERKSDAIQRLWKERDELRAVNAQLLEALQIEETIYLHEKMPVPEYISAAIEAAHGITGEKT